MSIQNPNLCQRPLRTVLIGVSLEGESDQVVRSGLAVARAVGARVVLVHAIPEEPRLPSLETGLGDDYFQRLIADGREKLQGQIERFGINDSELAGVEVRAGVPHRVLVDAARRAGADLIVVGATGSGPFAAELLGSTADRVLRKAARPVLLVRGELPVPPRRALAPVDLSELSGDAYRCGMHLLAQMAPAGSEGNVDVKAVYASSFLDALALQRQTPGALSDEEVERRESEELLHFVLENRCDSPFDVKTALLLGEVRESCLNCHTPHGSNHLKLQKTSVPYLCQQCHANTRHPGTLYDGTTLADAGRASNRLFNRACLDCHASIHGSNHPSSPYLGH